MGRLARDKELREIKYGEERVLKTGLKNNITKYHEVITSKGFASVETSSEYIDIDGQKKYRLTIVNLEIADLIEEYDISIGYDNTKDAPVEEGTKGYFVAFYKGKKQKLHRMIYKYLKENMSIEDIFNSKPSECDGKEIHHINNMSWDNKFENLKLTSSVQEHNEYHKNISLNICFNNKTNKFTLTDSFKTVISIAKFLKKDFKGELPSDNEDYQTLYNELENYLEINKDIL